MQRILNIESRMKSGPPRWLWPGIAWMPFLICCFFSSCAHIHSDGEGAFDPGGAVIRFYNGPMNSLRAVRRGHCPMYPSCSEYAGECFEKHGFFTGTVMMFDRLMRCGRDETGVSPKIFTDNGPRFHDPVENNDFWWHGGASAKGEGNSALEFPTARMPSN